MHIEFAKIGCKQKKHITRLAGLLLLPGLVWTGCGQRMAVQASAESTVSSAEKAAVAERTGTFFDTVISLKIYGADADVWMDGAFAICQEMEDTLSAQRETSELYRVNHRTEQTVTVSEDLADCIREGLYYSEISDGAFCITILPVKELWDFETEDHLSTVPDPQTIDRELAAVDDSRVHLDGLQLRFDDPETQIDLGGIAKGYISEKLKDYLKAQGCTSALINLGGNVSTIGTKPDGSAWSVGIQKPFSDRGEILTVVEATDQCVISSGTYERYFISGDKLYHHILDPKTGYPAETDLTQVTVMGTDDTACDALATVGIIVGEDGLNAIIEKEQLPVRVLYTDEEEHMDQYPVSNEKK